MPGQHNLHVHHRDRKENPLNLSLCYVLFYKQNPPPQQEFERGRAFIFLEEIARQFVAEYGLTVATAIAYGMNSEFSQVLALEMRRFNEAGNSTIMNQVHVQIHELKNIMVRNIDNVTARGERIELLVNKTENLRNSVRERRSRWRDSEAKQCCVNTSTFLSFIAVGLLPADVAECGPDDVLAQRENVCDSGRHPALRHLCDYQHGLWRSGVADVHPQAVKYEYNC